MSRVEQLERAGTQRRTADERAARESMRSQVVRLEQELSGIVSDAFPHPVPAAEQGPHAPAPRMHAPHLLDLAELERTRDRLAARVADARAQLAERRAHQQNLRALLRRAREQPGHYKFLRIDVIDLGEGTCGTWEVRPRFGPIGMVAGWWQLKLSSGCP